jgi:endonuclease YncB( thermonuclease family)
MFKLVRNFTIATIVGFTATLAACNEQDVADILSTVEGMQAEGGDTTPSRSGRAPADVDCASLNHTPTTATDGDPDYRGTEWCANVVSVYDGDTLTVDVPDWAGTPQSRTSVRVTGIDTPEYGSRASCESERALAAEVREYARALVNTGDRVLLTNAGNDKYGRFLGHVTLPDGSDWARHMIERGYAHEYDGGTKESWCE